MKKFIALVAAIGALYYFKPGLFPSFGHKGAFDAKGNPVVLVFTNANCAPCEQVMQNLRERGVAFQELSLTQGDKIRERYTSLGGTGVIPFVAVGSRHLEGFDRGMLASVLGETYGDRTLTRFEQVFFANHFRPDGSPMVYMYSASWCGFCKMLREELDKRQVPYVELDVEKATERAVMEDTMNIVGLPVTYVGYTRFVGGSKIDQVLEAMKTAGKRRS